jgi:pimeloyl-ACP methyl ester carboxylesterase
VRRFHRRRDFSDHRRTRQSPCDRAFISLLRNSASWEAATAVYRNIRVPVRLIWGDHDWARTDEREHDRSLISGAEMVTVSNGGHFLPLDQPTELRELVARAACQMDLEGHPTVRRLAMDQR